MRYQSCHATMIWPQSCDVIEQQCFNSAYGSYYSHREVILQWIFENVSLGNDSLIHLLKVCWLDTGKHLSLSYQIIKTHRFVHLSFIRNKHASQFKKRGFMKRCNPSKDTNLFELHFTECYFALTNASSALQMKININLT